MTDPIMEEVYRAREILWQHGGGTMRGLVEYLQKREAERLAGKDLFAKTGASEKKEGAGCVREGRAGDGAGGEVAGGAATSRTLRGEGRRGGGGEDFGAKEAPAEREGSR